MAEQVRRRGRKSRSKSVGNMLTHSNLHTHLSGEVLLFFCFSIADAVLTLKLLARRGPTQFVESNPIANFIIGHWGPKGMVYFKFAMVATVFLIVQIIAHKRIETARKLLHFAILAVGAVVAYSAVLYLRVV
jgi:hypothetical protein